MNVSSLAANAPDVEVDLAQSRLFIARAPWTIFAPGTALAMVILSVNLLGDGLRDLLDVRLARRMV